MKKDGVLAVYRGAGVPLLPHPVTDEMSEYFITGLLGESDMTTMTEVQPSQDTLDRIKSVVMHSIDAEGADPDGRTSRSYGSEPEEALEEIYQLLFAEDEQPTESDDKSEQPTLW